MSQAAIQTEQWTMGEFLEWERRQSGRFEYDGANIVAMTGGSVRHQMVIRALRLALERQLPAGCFVFTEAMKYAVANGVRYPDLIVTCRLPDDVDTDLLEQADLLIEVLSPNSKRRDLVLKRAEYMGVPYFVADPVAGTLTRLDGPVGAPLPHSIQLDDSIVREALADAV